MKVARANKPTIPMRIPRKLSRGDTSGRSKTRKRNAIILLVANVMMITAAWLEWRIHKPTNTPGPVAPGGIGDQASAETAADVNENFILATCGQRASAVCNCPQLFVLGAQKAGTTTLATSVRRHPRVRLGRRNEEEMNFFSALAHRPSMDRASLFRHTRDYVEAFGARTNDHDIGADFTSDYLMYPAVPQYMVDSGVANNSTRFLVVLREPVDRFISGINMEINLMGQNMTHNSFDFSSGMPLEKNASVNIEELALAALQHITECRNGTEPAVRTRECRSDFRQRGVMRSMTLLQSVYVDQLHFWLNHFQPHQICIIESKLFFKDLHAGLKKRAERCLNDVGISVDQLVPIAATANVGSYKVSVDTEYPNLRSVLNSELFEKANEELFGLLKDKWGITDFDL